MDTFLKYLPIIIAFIVGVVISPLLTGWKISSQYDIASKSGAFDKPNPCLYFGDQKLLPHSETRIIYGYIFEDQSPIIASLPLQIVNEGKKTLRNVSLTIRYPKNPKMILSETELSLKGAGILDGNDPKRTTSELAQFDFASWFLNDINPKIMFGIGESIRLIETKPIVETFRDGNQWFKTSVEYSLPLQVTIAAEDIDAKDYILLLHSIKSANIDDLSKKYYDKVKDRSQRIRESISYFKLLMFYLTQTQTNDILLYLSKDNQANQKIISYYPLQF